MKVALEPMLKLLLVPLVISACLACGEKQDYSGDNELAKTQTTSGKAAVTAAKGASVHAALMVPQQRHP